MSFALTAGVTGLQAHQKMLDLAGNNLANINTSAYKASRITFSELLSETVKKASQPTSTVGGTNPQQMGSGVGVANIIRDMSQGNIVQTGQPLDMALEGEGYFVLNDGAQDVYSRIASFGVDANSTLVDPATGYRVQRIGSEGEAEGFQKAGDSTIHIPYDTALPARETGNMVVSGNLSANGTLPSTTLLKMPNVYTVNNNAAQLSSKISDLQQFTGSFAAGQTGTLTLNGTTRDGTAVSTTLAVDATTTMQSIVDEINTLMPDSIASLGDDGKIAVADRLSGYSKTDLNMSYASSTGGTDSLETPGYFKMITAGGQEMQTVNISIVDSQGGKQTFEAAFVRTGTANTWDMVLTSVTGDVSSISDRRIEGVTFSPTGAFMGLADIAEKSSFGVSFAHDPLVTQTIQIGLGTVGSYDGLTQFSGNSTAVINKQDGYEAGRLSSLSVNPEGTLIGAFSNGQKKNIANIQIALFQNSGGLESAGNGYFISTANSGEAVATQALSGGAGTIHGSSLEKSNVDVASEFVNMIEAQNGYQANARTIRVANDILKELSSLIR